MFKFIIGRKPSQKCSNSNRVLKIVAACAANLLLLVVIVFTGNLGQSTTQAQLAPTPTGPTVTISNTLTASTPIPAPSGPISVREILLGGAANQDFQLKGLADRANKYLNLPSNWRLVAGSYIKVNLSHSPLLIPQLSNLTLLLNDKPVSSLRLDASNLQAGSWLVPFPADIQPDNGALQISFAATLRTVDVTCPVADDQGSWVTVSGSSLIHLAYNVVPVTSLAALPQTLFSGKDLHDRRVSVVVPKLPTPQDLKRASQILSRFGSLAGSDSLDASLRYGELADTANSSVNQILVGGPAIYPLLSKFSLPAPLTGQTFSVNGQAVADGTGVIQLASPALTQPGQGTTLVISGNNEDGVDRAVQALLDDRTLSLMTGAYYLVQPTSQFITAPTPPKGSNGVVSNGHNSFTNLGFDAQTVYGLGIQDAHYTFSIPSVDTPTGDAQLSLDYSFSGVVDSHRSSLAIILNYTSLQAIALTSATTSLTPSSSETQMLQTMHLNVSLPQNILHKGVNTLDFRFAMYIESPCGNTTSNSDIWGAIYPTSDLNMQFTQTSPQYPTLDQLPYPFVGGSGNTLVVLPETPLQADLTLAAQLTAELSRNEPAGQFNHILLAQAGQLDKSLLSQDNVVLLGTPATNSLIQEANSKLPVQWSSDLARTLSTQRGLVFAGSDAGLVGLVQVIRSPWNQSQAVLAIMSDSAKTSQGQLLVPIIGRNLYPGRYSGVVMVVDGTGKTYTFTTFDQPTPTPLLTANTTAVVGNAATVNITSTSGTGGAGTATGSSNEQPTSSVAATSSSTSSSSGFNTLLIILLILVIGVVVVGVIFFIIQQNRSATPKN